ncbi:MAG: NAD-dependent epimerase/dehydratase family protein [Campylobacteraceae bacterium]
MIKEDLKEITSNPSIDWAQFSNTTILITGANGFLPAYMVDTLMFLNTKNILPKKCKVFAMCRNEMHAKIRFNQYLNDKNFNLIIQDVSSSININCTIDFIVHAASPASPKFYNTPVNVIMPNIVGTINVLELSRKNNLKSFLYFSSGEVYGSPINENSIDEKNYGYIDPTSIRACYAESKRMGENLCISYFHQYNIPAKIVRPFHTYGPGMKLDDGRVFADFVKNIVYNENIELKSQGEAIRPFCYISDATIAFFKILLYGKNSEAYNVANPYQSISIKNLADTLVSIFPEKNLHVITVKQNDNYLQSPIMNQKPDISKMQSLGWNPSTDIKTGFQKTINYYQ